MKAQTTPKCESCTYCQAIRSEGIVIEIVCRRYPPAVILNGQSSAFPLVLEDDSCGEFKARQ